MGLMNKSPERKAELGYTDAKSFVRPTGEEVLFGEDWRRRKMELQERSAGLCERWSILHKPHVVLCRTEGEEPHHIIPRRDGRDDRLKNLANLSHFCHLAEDERVPRWTKNG